MILYLIGCESLGVRGLSCFIKLGSQSVLIDPGVALGYTRYGLHPHPLQAAFSEITKVLLTSFWHRATDIVVTHFHGDHVPLYNANPFQLSLNLVKKLNDHALLWMKDYGELTPFERTRFEKLSEYFKSRIVYVNDEYASNDGLIEFSGTYPHGLSRSTRVMVVKVGEPPHSIVHLSDTQLLADGVIDKVRSWSPRVVITDGPPLYRLSGAVRQSVARKAVSNALRLADYADYVIIDHHIARSIEGMRWLDRLRREVGNRIMCAADYMRRPRLLLEAWRRVLYNVIPVPRNWFIISEYSGFGKAISSYGDVIEELVKSIPREVTLDELEVKRILKDAVGDSRSYFRLRR